MLTTVPKLATVSTAALAHDLRIAVTRITRRLRHVAAGRSVTLTQLSALSSIGAAGQQTLGELAARERVQPPSMTRVVAGLVDSGLVQRSADPRDGRQVLVDLTPAGRALLEEEIGAREAWLSTRLNELSPDEREILREAGKIFVRLADDE